MSEIKNLSSKFKPTIFIASSSEGLDAARAIKTQFDDEATVDIWNEDIFYLNKSFLASLLNLASFYDYAIMVFSSDDLLKKREQEIKVPRDNVIFENGLFLGRLGPNRTFIVCEKDVDLFSDYRGITVATYEKRENMVSAVGNACNLIRPYIQNFAKNFEVSFLPSTALAIGYYNNFIKKITDALIEELDMKISRKENQKLVEEKYDYINSNIEINILLPDRISELEPLRLKSKLKKFSQISLKTPFRSFPFYVKGELPEGSNKLELIDIPTTLLASKFAIEKVFDDNFLNHRNNREIIERKEILNFEKTMRVLIPDDLEDISIKIENLGEFRK